DLLLPEFEFNGILLFTDASSKGIGGFYYQGDTAPSDWRSALPLSQTAPTSCHGLYSAVCAGMTSALYNHDQAAACEERITPRSAQKV
ncbi:hypothetical protein E4U58_000812, partial [Claviceps cyperi]